MGEVRWLCAMLTVDGGHRTLPPHVIHGIIEASEVSWFTDSLDEEEDTEDYLDLMQDGEWWDDELQGSDGK